MLDWLPTALVLASLPSLSHFSIFCWCYLGSTCHINYLHQVLITRLGWDSSHFQTPGVGSLLYHPTRVPRLPDHSDWFEDGHVTQAEPIEIKCMTVAGKGSPPSMQVTKLHADVPWGCQQTSATSQGRPVWERSQHRGKQGLERDCLLRTPSPFLNRLYYCLGTARPTERR